MYLLQPNAPIRESLSIILAGVEIEFVPAILVSGRVVMAALVADGDEGLGILRQARRMSTVYTIVGESYGVEWQNRKPRAAKAPVLHAAGRGLPATNEVPPMVRAALHNGWTQAEVASTGRDGQWGPEGGLSEITGLSAADMALCVPPPGWSAAAESRWPWQVAGFQPPGDQWIHPELPNKEPLRTDPAAVSVEAVSEEPEAKTGGFITVDDAPAFRDAPVSALSEFSEPQRVQAIVVLAELVHESGGARPSYNKLNHRLRKAGLPTVGKDELAALFALYETT